MVQGDDLRADWFCLTGNLTTVLQRPILASVAVCATLVWSCSGCVKFVKVIALSQMDFASCTKASGNYAAGCKELRIQDFRVI